MTDPLNSFFSQFYASVDELRNAAALFVPESVLIGGLPFSREALVASASILGPGFQQYALWQYLTQGLPASTVPNPVSQQLAAGGAYPTWADDIGGPGGSWTTGETMTVIIPNAYRVSIVMSSGTRDVVNVVGVLGTASGQETAAATAVLAAWKVANGPLSKLCNLVAMQWVEATDLSSSSGGIARVADTTTGTLTGLSLATAGAAALVKWNGNSRSRSTRGRTYYGPIDEGMISADGRTLSSSAKTNVNTAFTNFRNSLVTAGFPLQVISRTQNAVHAVTLQTVEDTIATQRRRIRS